MFYSMSIEENSYNLFELFVRRAKEGSEEHQKIVNDVLRIIKDFTNEMIVLNEISSKYYSIILYLAHNEMSFFKTLDPNIIGDEQYDVVLKSLSKQKSHQLA